MTIVCCNGVSPLPWSVATANSRLRNGVHFVIEATHRNSEDAVGTSQFETSGFGPRTQGIRWSKKTSYIIV